MKDTRSKTQLYLAAAKRLYMWHFQAKKHNLVLVTEFPKSGASWFCQMFRDASGLPFPRNNMPKMEPCILQGHHLFHPRMNKAIAVMRDGRDIMVSAYFFFLFDNDRSQPQWIQHHRNQVAFENYDNVKENMPRFIDYMFKGYAQKNRFHFNWSEFVENVYRHRDKLHITRYEDLLLEPGTCLKNALEFYGLASPGDMEIQEIVEKYSFKNLSKRKPGEENRGSFARKGISGDWKNYFNEEACDRFKEYAGAALIKSGYEKDLSWKVTS